jgi:hypothetical protein
MTKRNRILGMLAIFGMSVVMMTSCGGGSSSVSGKKLASNEFLGDMPNLVYQKAINDSNRDAQKDAEKEKVRQDPEKWKKMEDKFDAEEEAAEEHFNAEVEKLKPSLVGKELPFEVEDGCGYEVSGLKISNLNSAGVQVEFEVTITDGTVIKTQGWGTLAFYFQAIDKDGNLIGKDYFGEFRNTTINMSQKNSTTANGSFYLVNDKDAAEMANFAKIKFVKAN